ncbi:mitochondrial mRNA pseudouridine synthase RPUSD3 [Pleurodeles waltl]
MNCFKYLPAAGRTWVIVVRCLRHSFGSSGTLQSTSAHTATNRISKNATKLQTDKRLVSPVVSSSILKEPGITDLRKLTKDDLVELLANSVVYKEGVLVAVNKPPGLSIAGMQSEATLLSFLPDLAVRLGVSEELHVVKAATKESSGLVLLSSSHTTTKELEEFFIMSRKSKRPVSTYCAVTIGVPDPEGEITVALKAETIGDHNLVIPVKYPSRGSLEKKEVKRTKTYYKVLNSSDGCALVQLQPMSAFQSQLQVHATMKLCPILGDHVYSARVGKVLGQPIFLPVEYALPRTQVLEENLLQKMHISKQQMDRMPLHLHLHQLLIPDGGPGSTRTVTAPLPPFFTRTLKLLGLTMQE